MTDTEVVPDQALVDLVAARVEPVVHHRPGETPQEHARVVSERVLQVLLDLGVPLTAARPPAVVDPQLSAALLERWGLVDRARLYTLGLGEAPKARPISQPLSVPTWRLWDSEAGRQIAMHWVRQETDALARIDVDRQALLLGVLSEQGCRVALEHADRALTALTDAVLLAWDDERQAIAAT